MYLWLRLGNRKFEKLRQVLILPTKRTLQVMKNTIPHGAGYQPELFEQLRHLWSKFAKSEKDWDCILSWDATGYKRSLKFNKNTGMLIGFGAHPESFSMHHMFSEKVCKYIHVTMLHSCISSLSCVNVVHAGELFHGFVTREGH